MAQPLVVEQSRVVPVAVDTAFHGTLPIPLPEIFGHWYGPIPPIKEVRDQTGDWDAAGQSRTVIAGRWCSMREELTSVDPPRSFGYRLTDIKGPDGAADRLGHGCVELHAGGRRHRDHLALDHLSEIAAGRAGTAAVRDGVEALRASGRCGPCRRC